MYTVHFCLLFALSVCWQINYWHNEVTLSAYLNLPGLLHLPQHWSQREDIERSHTALWLVYLPLDPAVVLCDREIPHSRHECLAWPGLCQEWLQHSCVPAFVLGVVRAQVCPSKLSWASQHWGFLCVMSAFECITEKHTLLCQRLEHFPIMAREAAFKDWQGVGTSHQF